MNLEEMLQMCEDTVGCDLKVINLIVKTFMDEIVKALSQGQTVNLGEDFGVFSVKLRTPHLTENSPRTPKDIHYKVVFRESKGVKQRLKMKNELIQR